MANLFDYIAWRGDLPFSADPFNEVDNLILSELAFLDFSEVVTQDFSTSVTLRDAIAQLAVLRESEVSEDGILIPKEILPLAQRCAESRRFGEIGLCGFVCRTDTRCEMQFAAVTFLIGDGTAFTAFRGTDDTLVGWKEDFNMTFLSVVPSQSIASRYLLEMASVYPHMIRAGGHSKGGNLAIYAAATLPLEMQRRILTVYNNDGPGFSRNFLDADGYGRIRDRVRTIVPQTSIVGMLLEHECAYTIVKSSENGLFQHDGFSWEVLGASFVRLSDRTDESKFIDRTLKGWIAALDVKEREAFIEEVYAILSETRAETLSDIRADKDALGKILKGITPERRRLLQKMLRDLIGAGQRVMREDQEEKREEKRVQKELLEAERRVRKNLEEEEKRVKRAEKAALTEARRQKRAALMVAVQPIRFRVVKAEVKKKSTANG